MCRGGDDEGLGRRWRVEHRYYGYIVVIIYFFVLSNRCSPTPDFVELLK